VCLCVLVCVLVCVVVIVCLCVLVCVFVCVCVCECVCVCVCVCVIVCVLVCACVCLCVLVCACPLPHCRIHTHSILIFAGHDVLHSAFPSHPTKPCQPNKNREAAEPRIAGLSLDGPVAYIPTFIVMSQTHT